MAEQQLSPYDQRLRNGYYFTGSQSHIYIGDNKLTEINALQGFYQMDYNPVYGYASTHFDAMAHGKAIGAGNFTINYVFPGYLLAYLEKGLKKEGASASARAKSYEFKDLPQPSEKKDGDSAVYNNDRDKVNANIYEQAYLSDDAIKQYQQAYWGNDNANNPLNNNISASLIQHPEFIGPFDIIVRDFKIGSTLDELSYATTYVEKRMIDCFITKYSTVRSPSPTATQEQYDFICRIII